MSPDKKNESWHYDLAKEFKKRNNPNEFKPCIGIVLNLNPIRIAILNGEVILTEQDNLIITEWFKKRWDIDKEHDLSVDLPAKLNWAKLNLIQAKLLASSAVSTDVYHSNGASCSVTSANFALVQQAIDQIAEAIDNVSDAVKINKEALLELKLDLQVGDSVFIVPATETDKFFLTDKVLN